MNTKKIITRAVILLSIIILCYSSLTYLSYEFKKTIYVDEHFKYNEFGDFVGGVLNPLFALISTFAVIYITYRISNNEAKRSNEALDLQKNITLTSLRHEALTNLISKLNSYTDDLSKLDITGYKIGSLIQKIKTNAKKEDQPSYIWLVISLELDSFNSLTYLFDDLINDKTYIEKYEYIMATIDELIDEESKMKMVTVKTISKFIKEKQIIVTKIGEFILSQMDKKKT